MVSTEKMLKKTVLHIGVCDDTKDERDAVTSCVRDFFKLTDLYTVKIYEFESGLSLIDAYQNKQQFDILLLDVLMKNCNGLETAAQIRTYDPHVLIIFLTNSPEYAIESYNVNAFYYLLKSAEKEKVYEVLQKTILKLKKIGEPKLTLKTPNGLEIVYCHDIEFVEVFGRKVVYHLNSGQMLKTTDTLKKAEEELLSLPKFCKIHRCIIVNVAHVTKYTNKNVQTLHSPNLPISKSACNEFIKKLLL